MCDSHINFGYSTVATAPAPPSSGTSLIVAAGDGAKFPAVPFNAVIWPAGTQPLKTNAEVVRVTNIAVDTLTITRTQESSSARTVLVGDQIMAAITTKTLTDIENAPYYAVGNTTNASSGSLTAGAVSFSGAGAVSVGVSNGSVVISAAAGGQTNQTLGLYGVGNTTQNSSTTLDARTLSFRGNQDVTVGFSNGTIQLSVNVTGAQSNQSAGFYAVGNTTQNSSTTLDARTLSFNFLGGVSGGYSNGSIDISASPTSSLAAGGALSLSTAGATITVSLPVGNVYASSNTFGTSSGTFDQRTLSIAGSGNVSIAASNSGWIVSVPNQTNQTVGLYALGNTTQNSSTTLDARTLSFNGLGIVTVGYSNGSIQISATDAAQTNQTVGLYALGNTTQNSSTTLDARTLSFNGLGEITVGYSNGSIQLSAPTQTNQTVGLYGVGNTTQNSSTTLDARTISYDGLGAMTVGFSNGSVQLSVPVTSSLVGTSGISVSTNGSTISVILSGPFISYWANVPVMNNSQTMTVQGSTQYVFPLGNVGDFLSASYLRIPFSGTAQSTSFATTGTTGFSGSLLSTINAVIYSLGAGANSLSLQSVASGSAGISQQWSVSAPGNGSQYTISYKLSYPLTGGTSSFSTTTVFSNGSIQMSSGVLSNFTGNNFLDIPFANSLAPGNYWMALAISSTNSTQGTAAITGLQITGSTLAISQPNLAMALYGGGTNSSVQMQLGIGSWTTNAIGTTASIALANISSSASHPMPYVQFIREA